MKINRQTIELKGSELLNKVKEIIEEGNASKITVLDKDGKVLVEIPLSFGAGAGVLGIIVNPPIMIILAVVGAVGGIMNNCSIVIERNEETKGVVDVSVNKTEENTDKTSEEN